MSSKVQLKNRDLTPKANVLHCCTPQQAGGGWHFPLLAHHGGEAYPWGEFDFGPYLVDGQQGGGIHGGGSAKPKVLLLAKPLDPQYYFAPFSKEAK